MLSEERKGLALFSAAEKAGNAVEATRLLYEWVNDDPGGFDQLPPAMRAMHLDNARTVLLDGPPLDKPVTCTELGQLKVPVIITRGEKTQPFFRVLSEAAHRCIPGSQSITIANARHGRRPRTRRRLTMNRSIFLQEIDDNGPTRYVIAVAKVPLPSPVTNLRRCYANEQMTGPCV